MAVPFEDSQLATCTRPRKKEFSSSSQRFPISSVIVTKRINFDAWHKEAAMVIIIDMNSGERIFAQDAKPEDAQPQSMVAGFICPGSQAQPLMSDELHVMPALMEHTFSATR
jgi:hypothetical protein